MTALQAILAKYRSTSLTEREKGTYFEELIRTYFRYEASYADLYSDVWLFADWAKEIGTPQFGISAKDTGIDLVAKTRGTEEYHAIQCKCFAPDYRVRKADIDSFFTASGRKPFTQRIIVTTTNDWSEHAEDALLHQQPPVYKIDLHDLEKSQIDWAKYQPSAPPALKPKKTLRPHQTSARTNVLLGFQSADRGKLIMACGTGKTFTSLKIAEESAGKGKLVLFLVPSLNLLSQTLTEWTQESVTPLHSFAVCSDAEVGKKRDVDQDIVETFAHELRYPATTDAKRLAHEVKKRHDAQHMSVIFSTYHSLEVISRAQQLYGLPEIDLVICDEAHRTTGAIFDQADESTFTKIHDNEFIHAAKRLYMTATPRIYADSAKATAERESIALCSMDDEALYGRQLHVITFSEAVELKLLTDYKVLVLTIDEAHVSARLQDLLKDENNQLKVDDAARIIGCWKALSKQGVTQDLSFDPAPMRRAVAFCQVIERQKGARTHKVSSKQIAAMFKAVVDAYQAQEESDSDLLCEAAHVDGTMNASQKEEKLDWLKAEPPPNTCRILSNVRCLSEGVDVPALDAVLFLTPRNSQVDVVQSVGRVMRRTPDGKKQLGYVILPVVIPTGMEPHEALNDNKVYKVVWDVLQALRSHDDRFDAFVNKLDLIGKDPRKMEVIAITDKIERKSAKTKSSGNKDAAKNAQGQFSIGTMQETPPQATQAELAFNVGELERALYAKVVKKCGNRNHWEDWANDIARIAQTHIARITAIVSDPKNEKEVAAFQAFATELRDDLNDSITDPEVIEMLAQHLITKPVFDALFADYSFASQNPVSQAMQGVLDVLHEHRLEKEADTLEKFYASVARRAEGIDNAGGKQKIVVELYDKFFRNAFPKMTERLGIVYTPVEVVDFIIHSIDDLLRSEFGQTLGSKGVHIIDPFTGTGTFITRLLQSGLIRPEELPHKYRHEIHANEIVLLAYYIAAINIEAVYHAIMREGGASAGMGRPYRASSSADSEPRALPWAGMDRAVGPDDPKPEITGHPTDSDASAPKGHPTDGHASAAKSRPREPRAVVENDASVNAAASVPHGLPTGDPSAGPDASALQGHLTGDHASAPKGHPMPAQGNALGPDEKKTPSPVRATCEPFQGICLTDTFRLGEEDLISGLLANNSNRRKRQQKLEVRVIMGNPPYSVGQKSDNDQAANVKYEALDESLKNTYVAASSGNPRSLYNSYIRAFRWASDRIGTCGIIAYVSDAGWLQSKAADGLRKCVIKEFDSIYVFNLRGDARTSGEQRRREKDNVFGQGSRTPIAITLLVKRLKSNKDGFIRYCDIGDYLDQQTKLRTIAEFASIAKMETDARWEQITPDEHADWLEQRDTGFARFIVVGDKKQTETVSIFEKRYSSGVKTNRDAWAYNASKAVVSSNMEGLIGFYNQLLPLPEAERTGINDPKRISWSWVLRERFKKGMAAEYSADRMTVAVYRPFEKTHLYYDRMFNENRYLMPTIFPRGDVENLLIVVKQRWSGDGQLALITDRIVDIQSDGGTQCFPLYLYEKADEATDDELLLTDKVAAAAGTYTRRDGISDAGLAHFQAAYPAPGEGATITKEELFHYIYGLLHSPDYRSRYADNLGKELPRIPAVTRFADFRAFAQAGRDLAHWHLHYETVAPHSGVKLDPGKTPLSALTAADYRVTKMKFAKTRDPETNKSINDKTTVIYNERITLRDIPLAAFEYVVNGKPALEWVMERQAVTTDKDSGIVNDANLWATETMGNPKYPLELFFRVVTASLETMKIVNGLPKLDI